MIPTDPLTWVRAVHFAATAMAAGTVIFLHVVMEPVLRAETASIAPAGAQLRARLKAIAAINLAVAFVSGGVWLILQAAAMSGLSLADALAENAPWTALTETRFGHVCALRTLFAILLALSLVASTSVRPGGTGLAAVALATVFIAALAWTGHAGAASGGTADLHLAADTLHLIAAGAWIGGLLPLALTLASAQRTPDPAWMTVARRATVRFSALGVVSVGTLLATGIVNTWFLAGSVQSITGTDYGRLLMVKVALFALMIAIAAINRFRLTPRLSQAPALAQLRANCAIELALGLLVVAIASVLGMLPPPLHMHH